MSLFKKWWGRGTKSSTFCQHLPSTLAGGLWVSETEKSINGENPASHLGPQPVSDLELCLITHCSLCLINRSCHTQVHNKPLTQNHGRGGGYAAS